MGKKNGFSLIEILIVVGILGLISTLLITALGSTRIKARDTKRKSDLNQIGRFLTLSCFLPETGGGDYDLSQIVTGIISRYPQYAQYVPKNIKDPKTGTDTETRYHYLVTSDGQACALYANLENDEEKVTLTNINLPTAHGGTGIFQTSAVGWNGSNKYFQISN